MFRRWRSDQWTILVLLISIVAFYWGFAAVGGDYKASHAYQLLGEGFLSGHTYLSEKPHPNLATLRNPYDPHANMPYRVQDFSYYKGKYYLYFGPVPALVWIPIKLVTGVDATDGVLMLIFAIIGSCALSWLIYLIAARQGWFSSVGLTLVILSVTVSSWIPFSLREPYFYATAICGAYCFSALGALCLWYFFQSNRKRWLLLSSLCLGLAVGCRITYAFNIALLGLAILYLWRRTNLRTVFPLAICAFMPWALCIAGLGIYNYARFGSFLEVGSHYMLTILGNMNDPKLPIMESKNFVSRLYYYLFHPLPWKDTLTFPFFEPSMHQTPWHENTLYAWYLEPLYGLLTNSPFSMFFLLFLSDWKTRKHWQSDTNVMVAALTLFSGAMFVFLLFYFFISIRYSVDFAPWFMAVGGLYYLHLLTLYRSSAHYRWLLVAGFLLAAYGVFTGTMAGYCSYNYCT